MAYQLVIFKLNDPQLGSLEAWNRAIRLEEDGHNFSENAVDSTLGKLVHKMWIDFDTEEEAAVWKLAHW